MEPAGLPHCRWPHHRAANGLKILFFYDAVFVVFRKTGRRGIAALLPQTGGNDGWRQLEGTWEVAFQPNRGAPATSRLEKLSSWSDSADAGVKFFTPAQQLTPTPWMFQLHG